MFPLNSVPIEARNLMLKEIDLKQLIFLSLRSQDAANDIKIANIELRKISLGVNDRNIAQLRIKGVKENDAFFLNIVDEGNFEKAGKVFCAVETIHNKVFSKCFVADRYLDILVPNGHRSDALLSLYNHLITMFSRTRKRECVLFGEHAGPFAENMLSSKQKFSCNELHLKGTWADASLFKKLVENLEFKRLSIHSEVPMGLQVKLIADSVYFKQITPWIHSIINSIIRVDARVIEFKGSSERILEKFKWIIRKWATGQEFQRLERLGCYQVFPQPAYNLSENLSTRNWDRKHHPGYFLQYWKDDPTKEWEFFDFREGVDVERVDGTIGTLFAEKLETKYVVWTEANIAQAMKAEEIIEKGLEKLRRDIEKSKKEKEQVEKGRRRDRYLSAMIENWEYDIIRLQEHLTVIREGAMIHDPLSSNSVSP